MPPKMTQAQRKAKKVEEQKADMHNRRVAQEKKNKQDDTGSDHNTDPAKDATPTSGAGLLSASAAEILSATMTAEGAIAHAAAKIGSAPVVARLKVMMDTDLVKYAKENGDTMDEAEKDILRAELDQRSPETKAAVQKLIANRDASVSPTLESSATANEQTVKADQCDKGQAETKVDHHVDTPPILQSEPANPSGSGSFLAGPPEGTEPPASTFGIFTPGAESHKLYSEKDGTVWMRKHDSPSTVAGDTQLGEPGTTVDTGSEKVIDQPTINFLQSEQPSLTGGVQTEVPGESKAAPEIVGTLEGVPDPSTTFLGCLMTPPQQTMGKEITDAVELAAPMEGFSGIRERILNKLDADGFNTTPSSTNFSFGPEVDGELVLSPYNRIQQKPECQPEGATMVQQKMGKGIPGTADFATPMEGFFGAVMVRDPEGELVLSPHYQKGSKSGGDGKSVLSNPRIQQKPDYQSEGAATVLADPGWVPDGGRGGKITMAEGSNGTKALVPAQDTSTGGAGILGVDKQHAPALFPSNTPVLGADTDIVALTGAINFDVDGVCGGDNPDGDFAVRVKRELYDSMSKQLDHARAEIKGLHKSMIKEQATAKAAVAKCDAAEAANKALEVKRAALAVKVRKLEDQLAKVDKDQVAKLKQQLQAKEAELTKAVEAEKLEKKAIMGAKGVVEDRLRGAILDIHEGARKYEVLHSAFSDFRANTIENVDKLRGRYQAAINDLATAKSQIVRLTDAAAVSQALASNALENSFPIGTALDRENPSEPVPIGGVGAGLFEFDGPLGSPHALPVDGALLVGGTTTVAPEADATKQNGTVYGQTQMSTTEEDPFHFV